MFDNVIGQEQAKVLFQRSIKDEKLAHAYVFAGPNGVGKFLFARELASALLCEKGTGCGKCRGCHRVAHSTHPSLQIIQSPSGKKNIPIDTVRELEREIMLKPFEGKYKLFIINDADLLSEEAANALLKTLEEPPKYSLIMLVTAQTSALLSTVLSRCQLIRFFPLPDNAVSEFLAKQMKLPKAEIKILVTLAGGSPGEAIRLFENGFAGQRHHLIDSLLQSKSDLIDNIINFGKRSKDNEEIRVGVVQQFKIISLFLRDILLLKDGIDQSNRLFNQDKMELLNKGKSLFTIERIQKALEQLIQAEQYVKMNLNIKLVVANTIFNI